MRTNFKRWLSRWPKLLGYIASKFVDDKNLEGFDRLEFQNNKILTGDMLKKVSEYLKSTEIKDVEHPLSPVKEFFGKIAIGRVGNSEKDFSRFPEHRVLDETLEGRIKSHFSGLAQKLDDKTSVNLDIDLSKVANKKDYRLIG